MFLDDHLFVLADFNGGVVECGCASMVTKLSNRNEGSIFELGEEMCFFVDAGTVGLEEMSGAFGLCYDVLGIVAK